MRGNVDRYPRQPSHQQRSDSSRLPRRSCPRVSFVRYRVGVEAKVTVLPEFGVDSAAADTQSRQPLTALLEFAAAESGPPNRSHQPCDAHLVVRRFRPPLRYRERVGVRPGSGESRSSRLRGAQQLRARPPMRSGESERRAFHGPRADGSVAAWVASAPGARTTPRQARGGWCLRANHWAPCALAEHCAA